MGIWRGHFLYAKRFRQREEGSDPHSEELIAELGGERLVVSVEDEGTRAKLLPCLSVP